MANLFLDSDSPSSATSLLRELGATEVFVFGSATRDALRPHSDVDIAVRGLPPSVYFSAISRATDLLGRPVDLACISAIPPRSSGIFFAAGSWYVSRELAAKIRVGLEELAIVR